MKIPYGNANFAEIRRKGSFYVDKTPFLPELENDAFGYKNLIFLRPRRFGKSSLISMMEHYYDISLADDQLLPALSQGMELRAGTLVFIGAKDVEWHPLGAKRTLTNAPKATSKRTTKAGKKPVSEATRSRRASR